MLTTTKRWWLIYSNGLVVPGTQSNFLSRLGLIQAMTETSRRVGGAARSVHSSASAGSKIQYADSIKKPLGLGAQVRTLRDKLYWRGTRELSCLVFLIDNVPWFQFVTVSNAMALLGFALDGDCKKVPIEWTWP